MFLFAALVTGQLFRAGDVSGLGFLLLSTAGILHFGLGRYFNYRSMAAIGATRTGPIQSFTAPYAVAVAYFLLDEGVTFLMGVGIVLVLVGPAVMVERTGAPARQPVPPRGASDTAPASNAPPAFQMRQAEGYLFALLSVGAYGTSPIMIRAALEGATDLSVLGGAIANTAAATALIVTLLAPGRRGLITAMRPSTVRLFLGAGFFVFLAQMFRFIALSMAPVAVVTPLMRLSGVFTLVLSWMFNGISRRSRSASCSASPYPSSAPSCSSCSATEGEGRWSAWGCIRRGDDRKWAGISHVGLRHPTPQPTKIRGGAWPPL